MRKLVLYIACSLDNKIARADHSLDWLPEPEAGSEEDYGYYKFYDSVDTLLMGYKTYEVCIGFDDWPYKDKTTYIFSREDKPVIEGVTLVNEYPVAFSKALKDQKGKDIWLVGGGAINQLMHDAGLIDEYIITIIPVILGNGIELFPNITSEYKLSLKEQKAYPDGVVQMHYVRV